MIRVFVLIVLLSFLTSACSLYRVSSQEVTKNIYPAKESPNEVAYLEEVKQPYEIVGFVTVNTERRQGLEEVIIKMKREAAILGGDAITNITTNATRTWKKIPPQKLLKNGYVRANFTATVIAFQ